MKTLRKIVSKIELVPAEIQTFKWYQSVHKSLGHLPCSACKALIGTRRWALVWAREENQKDFRSYRLCEECGKHIERQNG